MAHLVQDFSRLGVAFRLDRGRLSGMSAVMIPSRPKGVLNQGIPA